MEDCPVALVPGGAVEDTARTHALHRHRIATEMARRGAAKLKENGVSALVLPSGTSRSRIRRRLPRHHELPPRRLRAAAGRVRAAGEFRAVAMVNVPWSRATGC